ncbi:MAG: hypothetical protein AAF547_06450 [Actinomycetota bacterium]
MKKLTHLLAALVALATMATLLAAPSSGQATRGPADTAVEARPAQTGPPTTTPGAPSKDQTDAYNDGVKAIADQLGLSIPETREFLDTQDKLVRFGESVLRDPDYIEFAATPDGRSGILVVEPDTPNDGRFADTPIPDNVEVRTATLTRTERADLAKRVTAATKADAVTYDPIDDRYDVIVTQGTGFRTRVGILNDARDAAGPDIDLSVRPADPDRLARGGRGIVNQIDLSQWCTTGWGVWDTLDHNGGYLTTGHCGLLPYTIDAWPSQFIDERQVGGYQDRMRIVAGGVSWMTQITPTVQVDMEAHAGHIFRNVYYCHFGQASRVQRCGTVNQVNVVINDLGYTIYVSKTPADCELGDSGGPVWRYSGGKYWPSGMIASATGGNGDCGYTALDDNLFGTHFVLY